MVFMKVVISCPDEMVANGQVLLMVGNFIFFMPEPQHNNIFLLLYVTFNKKQFLSCYFLTK